ncbi:CDP-alcohol phosphatidyltransferase family protein [Aporhodopirellula aestuarii]|uniref:CDP-alcohol phosphatidyltransferase family protein n=1 Tax=Aporhodopirellula aestuarii TaxID=2950107 RepID=A0ABT0U085_9BACT|nr:CDP-alcohol phosphatidyltransferase family protein [Aporhodopirellula aestuarii]MCM2370307.1 CDP-alcohol phosphatidyltransferase family protein [Aporhodopirellula aestuarii]
MKWTIPNMICIARGMLSPLLVVLAWNGYGRETLILFLLLTLSDFVDGKLARWLDQRTEIGPRLDSFSDAIMYGCLALSLVFLRGELLADEVIWIVLAIFSYIVAGCYAVAKFGKLPSYHTRSAKTAWLLVAIAAASLLVGGPAWPLRVAMASVMLANAESGLLTHWLESPVSDLKSIFHLPR